MTVDLMSVRLKEAKRELTALKTAHRRGLGTLKVYDYKGTIPDIGDGFWDVTAHVSFNDDAAPFPFTYIELGADDDGTDYTVQLEVEETSYDTDGKNMDIKMLWIYFPSLPPARFRIVSTAPFEVSLSWEPSA